MADLAPIAEAIPDLQARIERLAATATPPTDTELPSYDNTEAREQHWRRAIPTRFQHARLDQLDGIPEWDGTSNVLLLGDVGVGKTHAAVALARQAHENGRAVAFYPSVELLDQLRPGGDPNALDRACRMAVLVLDDLGAERPTDWTAERLFMIVNRRWLEELPTVVTSNLNPKDLEGAVGPRMWSRLYHGAVRWTLTGPDRRKVTT